MSIDIHHDTCKNCNGKMHLYNVDPWGTIMLHEIREKWETQVICTAPEPVMGRR